MELKLPKKVLMIDAEFTGLDPQIHDILQLAMIKCSLDPETWTYKVSPHAFNEFIHTVLTPVNKFHIEHLSDAYSKANASTNDYNSIKKKVEEFIGDWKGQAWASGDCVFTALSFIYAKGIFTPNSYLEDDTPVPGTIDYRPFEMKPLKVLAQSMGWEKPKDELREHDALNDCVNQIKELNSCLAFFKGFVK